MTEPLPAAISPPPLPSLNRASGSEQSSHEVSPEAEASLDQNTIGLSMLASLKVAAEGYPAWRQHHSSGGSQSESGGEVWPGAHNGFYNKSLYSTLDSNGGGSPPEPCFPAPNIIISDHRDLSDDDLYEDSFSDTDHYLGLC